MPRIKDGAQGKREKDKKREREREKEREKERKREREREKERNERRYICWVKVTRFLWCFLIFILRTSLMIGLFSCFFPSFTLFLSSLSLSLSLSLSMYAHLFFFLGGGESFGTGQDGKLDKLTTTGRFGLGFNAVYHFTDLPSFVSGEHVVFLDPHLGFVPGATASRPGLRIRYVGARLMDAFPDQFAPFCHFGWVGIDIGF